MKNRDGDKVTWHVKAALEWAKSVLELFPALWDAARIFAPLVLDYCETCGKPRTVLWIPVGDHDLCDRMETVQDIEDLADLADLLPPL